MGKRGPHHKKHIKRFFLIPTLVLFFGSIMFSWSIFTDASTPNQEVQFGVTFSTKYASYLGLDWKQVYLASLDDLHIKFYRIPIYWDEIESEQGNINLDNVRWMLDEADKRGVKVILAIGQRVPRWPECHPPAWTRNLSKIEIQEQETRMIDTIVTELKDYEAVDRWQVENEPFFAVFGECTKPDEEFISKTVARVKQLDPTKPIIITDSGELSTWADAAGVGDILGISMYRVTWNSLFGYFYYPLPPAYYKNKAKLISPWVQDVIVTELQAEPWVPSTILTTSLEDQFHSMNPKRFLNNVEFARRTSMSQVYLWGVEWWYWLKQYHNYDAMWETARTVFNN
ncbi:MAG: hypothetical protein A2233_00100 [Candidatus Kerfeldbacteria bacterium RIFOXYA2_FULL_38_24]|uniref:Uncharacterized protein n=1 Tax=Candidatus Kerfeldbacteria bacterium RIFOXYB2_FULL_38_14 TaxID=1798547 RepID=A0A1G2BBA5_9BACT|nr:MAG: hypothetical protein A2233_00100 [Candidatus Kerfeldbacteria bacterium RIFOXYA2_FULL_38_24]OGY85996.1 MAG: hypothetical protein A2319_00305 [Candidatus Kerfeldbacteria bacterium RIFOXYB2_FULL_38_14]